MWFPGHKGSDCRWRTRTGPTVYQGDIGLGLLAVESLRGAHSDFSDVNSRVDGPCVL